MTSFLLDVNVLVSLLHPLSPHHGPARKWFEEDGQYSWLTSAITQNGAIRLLSNPAISRHGITFAESISLLEGLLAFGSHQFLPEAISLLDPLLIDRSVNVTPRQTTDVYLLALAVHHGVTFATFDRSVVARAVVNGPEHLLVLR